MESASQTAARLLTAIEELLEREEACVRFGRYEQAWETRQTTAPLVAELVRLAYAPDVNGLRPRVAALIGRSTRHAAVLQEKMQAADRELRRLAQASLTAGQVMPAYGISPVEPMPRFQAAG